jgi:hypothetical protein
VKTELMTKLSDYYSFQSNDFNPTSRR